MKDSSNNYNKKALHSGSNPPSDPDIEGFSNVLLHRGVRNLGRQQFSQADEKVHLLKVSLACERRAGRYFCQGVVHYKLRCNTHVFLDGINGDCSQLLMRHIVISLAPETFSIAFCLCLVVLNVSQEG
jgi:hypothetical protein